MIIGIGTDIVEIERIKKAVEKWDGRFLNKIYTEKEISYCYLRKNPFAHLAGRFAAKEAVIKAFAGFNKNLLVETKNNRIKQKNMSHVLKYFTDASNAIFFRRIEISNDDFGRPFVILNVPEFNVVEIPIFIHLTISHEKSYAIATALIEIEDT